MASLKVTTTGMERLTLTAPLAGLTDATCGGLVSTVNDQTAA